ncbi:Myb-like_DNA-binding domain-containing protein [Hexamita inflata]|uniref:Myb-like DNA-binding domain-containing protein n=1 Tax=Hexamita inflata TaxID=28002 RepID=A0AA86N7R0_9EUKA|nr:Myb-like DNA-binding domain-containing protein [Hexamita inflata]CAI9934706.1 Myb-like DNA-binding domain-containing protein [Hexamita inflata]
MSSQTSTQLLPSLLQIERQQLLIIQQLDEIVRRHQGPQQNQPSKWTEEEHQLFLQQVNMYGRKKLTKIAHTLQTKSIQQVASHSQKFFLRLRTWIENNVYMRDVEAKLKIQAYLLASGLKDEGLREFMADLQRE